MPPPDNLLYFLLNFSLQRRSPADKSTKLEVIIEALENK
jgi:hypothetical protein